MGIRKNTELANTGRGSESRQYVRSLARGLEVLKVFDADDRGLSNAEIARRTGFPKPTVSRLTFTLMALGYLHLDEVTGRYSLHPHILSLGYPVLSQLSIREIARPLMQQLADSCRGAVSMGVRDGLSMIVIERARHGSLTTVPLDIGVDRDLAKTALGRAYLAGLPDDRRQALLAEIAQMAPDMLKDVQAGIDSAVRHFHQHGYTMSAGEWMTDYHAVGVPLRLSNGNILAFNCGGLAAQVGVDMLPELGQRLSDMVADLARTQGAAR
ncbi:MAG: IclR family transcriptional regulator [Rhodospirillaceae bacterium]